MSGVACLFNTLKGPSSQLEGNKKPCIVHKGDRRRTPAAIPKPR